MKLEKFIIILLKIEKMKKKKKFLLLNIFLIQKKIQIFIQEFGQLFIH